MINYEKMYHTLFNAITDALDLLEDNNPLAAALKLEDAQTQTEEMYLSEV